MITFTLSLSLILSLVKFSSHTIFHFRFFSLFLLSSDVRSPRPFFSRTLSNSLRSLRGLCKEWLNLRKGGKRENMKKKARRKVQNLHNHLLGRTRRIDSAEMTIQDVRDFPFFADRNSNFSYIFQREMKWKACQLNGFCREESNVSCQLTDYNST